MYVIGYDKVVPFKIGDFQSMLIIRHLHNYIRLPYEAVIKTTRTFKHRVHIIRTVHTRDRKGACADTFVFKNLAPSGVRVCQNQKRFQFLTRIRIKYVFMVDLLNSNGIKDDYSLIPLVFYAQI